MAYQCAYPLLMQGFRMSKAAASVAANAVVNGQAVIAQNRGNVMFLDVMSMNAPSVLTPASSIISVQTGGNDLLKNIPATMYQPNANAGFYGLVCVDIEEGQTVNWSYDNSANGAVQNAALHLYYENPFLKDKKLLAQFDTKARGLKEVTFKFSATAATKVNKSAKLQLPSDQGNIIGIELFGENATAAGDIYQAFATLLINGVEVWDYVNLGLGFYQTARPYKRHPIFVEKSGTFQMECDNENSATANTYGVKFYFNQD